VTKTLADSLPRTVAQFKRPSCDFCAMPAMFVCDEPNCQKRVCPKHDTERDRKHFCPDHKEASVPEFNPTEVQPTPQPLVPKCPHCGTQPARVNTANTSFQSGLIAMVLFCSDCEKIHTIVPIGQAQPQIVRAGNVPPGLVKPS
jgi:hypothetical protein